MRGKKILAGACFLVLVAAGVLLDEATWRWEIIPLALASLLGLCLALVLIFWLWSRLTKLRPGHKVWLGWGPGQGRRAEVVAVDDGAMTVRLRLEGSEEEMLYPEPTFGLRREPSFWKKKDFAVGQRVDIFGVDQGTVRQVEPELYLLEIESDAGERRWYAFGPVTPVD